MKFRIRYITYDSSKLSVFNLIFFADAAFILFSIVFFLVEILFSIVVQQNAERNVSFIGVPPNLH